jgi:hypothetical protein
VATVIEGAGDGVREARREFAATSERGVWGSGGGHAAQFRATAPSAHTLSERSENGLRETSSSKSSRKVQFGQEICPKCAILDKILVHIQTLDLGKGRLGNVLSFPNLKFSLDENNLHRWRCSKSESFLVQLSDHTTTNQNELQRQRVRKTISEEIY